MKTLFPAALMVATFLLQAPRVEAETGCSAITTASADCDNGSDSDADADSGPKRAKSKAGASMGDAMGKSKAKARLKIKKDKPWAKLKVKAKAEGEECGACAAAVATANGDYMFDIEVPLDETAPVPLTVRAQIPSLFLYTITDYDEATIAEQSYQCSVEIDGQPAIAFGIALADSEIVLSGDIGMDDLSIEAQGEETAVRLDDFEVTRVVQLDDAEGVHSFSGSASDSACAGGGSGLCLGGSEILSAPEPELHVELEVPAEYSFAAPD